MFFLTTIGNNLVAIIEVVEAQARQRGEYTVSQSCLERNVASGKFTEVDPTNHKGRVFVLTSDLNTVG